MVANRESGLMVLAIAGYAGSHEIDIAQEASIQNRIPPVVSGFKMAREAENFETKHAILKNVYLKNYKEMSDSDVKHLIEIIDVTGEVYSDMFGQGEKRSAVPLVNMITQHYAAYKAELSFNPGKK